MTKSAYAEKMEMVDESLQLVVINDEQRIK